MDLSFVQSSYNVHYNVPVFYGSSVTQEADMSSKRNHDPYNTFTAIFCAKMNSFGEFKKKELMIFLFIWEQLQFIVYQVSTN